MAGVVSPEPRGGRGRTSDAGNAAEKTMRLLEAAAAPGGPHRLGVIATAADVPKPSAHRILQTLVANGFLVADGVGGYAPGPRLRTLTAQVAATQAGAGIDEALRVLQRLTGNTVHLGLRAGDGAVYTHKVEHGQAVQMASRVGMRMPLHCTAIGKCIIADFSGAELADFVDRAGLPAQTPATLTTLDALHAELEQVRRDGVAVDDEENEATIRCVAAPVRDATGSVVGGVSVSTVTFLVPRARLLGWADAVRDTARRVSESLA